MHLLGGKCKEQQKVDLNLNRKVSFYYILHVGKGERNSSESKAEKNPQLSVQTLLLLFVFVIKSLI